MKALATAPNAASEKTGHQCSRSYRLPEGRVSPLVPSVSPPVIHRKAACACGGGCPSCQTKSNGVTPSPVPLSLRTVGDQSGSPLPEQMRLGFEQHLGHDLSEVRLHTGPNAERAARLLRAQAFTIGSDIVFGPGRYDPSSLQGQRLLAHELTHVVQQRESDRVGNPSGSAHEDEAHTVADGWPSNKGKARVRQRATPSLARLPESLEKTLDVSRLTDDDIRAELREIILWLSGQVRSTDESIALETTQAELQAELSRRHRERARTSRKRATKRGKEPSTAATTAPPSSPAPRSATTSFNFDELTREEQAEELQLSEEWLALAPKKDDWRKRHVRTTKSSLADNLAQRESAPLLESHNFVLGRLIGTRVKLFAEGPFNRFEAIARLRRHISEGNANTEHSMYAIGLIYEHRAEHPVVSRVSATLGGASNPEYLLDEWSRARDLLRKADSALDSGDFLGAVNFANDAKIIAGFIDRGVSRYFGESVTGAERAVTGLEVVKAGAAAAVTIGTGGLAGVAVGGLYSGSLALYQQTSEVYYGLRETIDWAGVGFDTAFGAITGAMGGKLGNAVLKLLLKNPVAASFGRRALAYAVSDYISGRAGSALQLTARTVFDGLRGQNVTWEKYIDSLAGQFTDPKQAAFDLILGHASRRATAHVETRRSSDAGDTSLAGDDNAVDFDRLLAAPEPAQAQPPDTKGPNRSDTPDAPVSSAGGAHPETPGPSVPNDVPEPSSTPIGSGPETGPTEPRIATSEMTPSSPPPESPVPVDLPAPVSTPTGTAADSVSIESPTATPGITSSPPAPSAVPRTPRDAAVVLQTRYTKLDSSQTTLDGLEDVFRRTMSGKRRLTPRPGEYLPSHTRGAAGELDAIRKAQLDPSVIRIRAVPQQRGARAQRTPDFEIDVLRPDGSIVTRPLEVRTVTGGRRGYQPTGSVTKVIATPENIQNAIASKIFPSRGRQSQLVAGGDLVVQIRRGETQVEASIAQAVSQLNPRLAGAGFLRQLIFHLPSGRVVRYVRGTNGYFETAP